MRFGDAITLHRGYDLPIGSIRTGKFPVVFSNGKIEYHSSFKIKGPGVVTGRSGTLGNTFYLEEDFWPHNTTLYVSDFHGNNPRFVYYLLKGLDFSKLNAGSGVPTLNRNHVHATDIMIPDVYRQREIASILTSFDEKMKNNDRIISTLETMAQAIFKEWFVKFRFPGHKNVKFVDSEMGKIPEGWGVKRVDELGNIITGKTPSTEQREYFGAKYPFITIPDLQNGPVIISTERYLSDQGAEIIRRLLIPSGTICVSCIATIGLVGITIRDSFTNQQLNSIIPSQENLRFFLYFTFLNMKTNLENFSAGGTATSIISKDKFGKITIVLPEVQILETFHESAKKFLSNIELLLLENNKLTIIRDSLLPKLMSGRLLTIK